MKHINSHYLLGTAMVILFALCIISCKQEQNETNPTGNISQVQTDAEYSGWSAPVNLGSVINTIKEEQHAFLSKDELSLFISSNRTGTTGDLDLWVSERSDKDSPWSTPQNLGVNINSTARDMAPSLSPDEHWLYYHSYRAGGCGGADLYVSHRHDKRDNFGWEPAINLGCVINGAFDDAGPTLYENEANGTTIMYFTSSRPGGLGDFDIYASILQSDGTFGSASLVAELSSPARDTRTSIRRRDGLEMFISSGRTGGFGDQDLWVSTRSTTLDPWGTLVNLGLAINTSFFDGAPALSFDAMTLIFFSNRPGGFGGNDLYMSTRTKTHGNEN